MAVNIKARSKPFEIMRTMSKTEQQQQQQQQRQKQHKQQQQQQQQQKRRMKIVKRKLECSFLW